MALHPSCYIGLNPSSSVQGVMAVSYASIANRFSRRYGSSNFDFDSIPSIFDDTSSSEHVDGFDFPSVEDWGQLPRGTKGGYRVVKQYSVPADMGTIDVQTALNLLDRQQYPTPSKARKACRKGSVLLQSREGDTTDATTWQRLRVGDSAHPGDVIGIQKFAGDYKKKQCYPCIEYSRPNFALPVEYEDAHCAIVNKPAGISIYGHRTSRSGAMSRRTVRAALPYVLSPPKKGTAGVLRQPATVHRLDTPTSGLLVVAKTKEAMDGLYEQFRERRIQKIYAAIINGAPKEEEDGDDSVDGSWNVIDYPLGQKVAITHWKVLRQAKSLNAKDGVLTLAEISLQSGRYHQIRRHYAWVCRRPLVGDALYAGKLQAHHFRRRGLYLCSRGIVMEHPYYNSNEKRRKEWENMSIDEKRQMKGLQVSNDGTIKVAIRLELPSKYDKLLDGEEKWAESKGISLSF